MWLSKKLTAQKQEEAASAEAGTVTIDSLGAGVYARGELRNVPVVAPGGFAWRPKGGENVLLLKGGAFEEGAYVLGTADAKASGIEAGEVRIYSADGAEIVLRNDGRIEIRGDVRVAGTLLLNGRAVLTED